MKEKTNILTSILIILSISVLLYINIDKEEVEAIKSSEENTIEEIEILPKIEKDYEINEAQECTPYISQVVITVEIKFKKNREARFFTRDTSITAKTDFKGRFSLTFPLDSSGYITFHHGDETTAMYCNPDDTVHITINTKMFDETITYTGSIESNYLAWKYLYQEESSFSPDVFNKTA